MRGFALIVLVSLAGTPALAQDLVAKGRYQAVLGEKCYASLRDIPERVDIVDCFRRSEDIVPIAEEAIAIGAKVLWMQLGVISQEAAAKARKAGLDVVMDRCVKIEHARLFGGLHWAGVNTGVISARRPV